MAKVLTKTQVWTNVQNDVVELLENNKVSKKFSEALMQLLEDQLKPKSSSGSSQHPPKLDEAGNVVEAYCRFHERYEVVDNMVMSKGKSKGYCKASISKWNKTNSQIKKLDSQAVDAMGDGDFDKAQELARESKELKTNLNAPTFYDFDADWLAFNPVSE